MEVAARPTVARMLADRATDDRPGLLSGDRIWTWRQVISESRQRASIANSLLSGDPRAPHIGILLDNLPEYLFWMGGAALAGAVVVGINPTRRGEELARDIRFTECRMIVTDAPGAALLNGLDTGVDSSRILLTDGDEDPPSEGGESEGGESEGGESEGGEVEVEAAPGRDPSAEGLYLLIFTSGTTGSPKAVRCTQGRLAAIGWRASQIYGFDRDDVCYCPMPLFHGNAVMALWAPALHVGACMAVGGRFSATRFIDDVRHYGATRFTYVGKALAYVLATPERPDDAATPLRIGFGTEASARDRVEFERRFGCRLVEGYGSSEGGISITRTPDTPPEALGLPAEGIAVLDRESLREKDRARIDPNGLILNHDESIGELACRSDATLFEGYFNNEEANNSRLSDGWYWTGDLAYRDEAGFVYFAGRNDDWLRVDSENFAAAPVERILERHPHVVAAAVYAVPDPQSADQVMAAVELRADLRKDDFCAGLGGFLSLQADLGTKWAPRFVRIVDALPLTATGKITKSIIKKQRWTCSDTVIWRSDRAGTDYRVLTPADVTALEAEFEAHGRSALLIGS